jgi:hypothetical protein
MRKRKPMSEHASGIAYLTVRRDPLYQKKLRAVKVTSKPPVVMDADAVVVKVNIGVPTEAFRPLDGGTVEVSIDEVARAPYLEALQ